ncbi:hypothetical protein ACFX1Z_010429 [Malus domestica]
MGQNKATVVQRSPDSETKTQITITPSFVYSIPDLPFNRHESPRAVFPFFTIQEASGFQPNPRVKSIQALTSCPSK